MIYLDDLYRRLRYFLAMCAIPAMLNAQIILTEVMFDCASDESHDEYIEIYNSFGDSAVDLTGWQISDSVAADGLADAGEGMLLLPGQYCVILDGSYFGKSTTYDAVIPDSARIVKIDDSAFGNYGLSNSVARKISLINAAGDTVQSYRYSLNSKPGFPDEKIMLTADNSPANWGNGLRNGGTPGFRNSITPCDYDLALTGEVIAMHPSIHIQTMQTVQITCSVTNLGISGFRDTLEIILFADADADTVCDADEDLIISQRQYISLDSSGMLKVSGVWTPQLSGIFYLTLQIAASTDENAANNFYRQEVYVSESSPAVVLNEVKFLTEGDEPEWIELYNKGETPVNLRNWGLADLMDTVRIDSSVVIWPGQYKVFASDTGLARYFEVADSLVCAPGYFPALNNDGDCIFLINPANAWVEQVPYLRDWLEGEDWRNPSLERIHAGMDSRLPTSWGPATVSAGATPGKQNSIALIRTDNPASVKIEPNPFSPDGDGYEDHAVISFQSPTAVSHARIEIFDAPGRKVRTILDNSFIGPEISAVWNGQDDHGQRVRMGIYIIWIQILDDRNGALEEYKLSVVVAGRL